MKVEAIADIITRHTVGAIYAKAKAMKIRGNENHRSEADVIMQMRRAGLQMEEIADRLGYYRSTLYRRLKTYSNDYKKTNRA
jgi:DNA-binding NtrC family response regulator